MNDLVLHEGPLPTAGPGFRLEAVDLFERFGFGDGDILDMIPDEYAPLTGLTADDLYEFDKDPVLLWLVEELLLPLCPEGVEVGVIGSNHNPVRATVWPGWVVAGNPPAGIEEMWVEVSWEVAAMAIRHVRTITETNRIVGQ